MTVVGDFARYKLDLMGVQKVRWYKGGTARAGDYTSFCGQGDENNLSGTGFFVHQRKVSAVKRANFLSDMMSYIVLRGLWCNIIVLNARAPTEEKNDDSKNRFYEEFEQVFDHFPEYHVKIRLGDFNAKLGRDEIFKPTI
jgi:hypothetical protein